MLALDARRVAGGCPLRPGCRAAGVMFGSGLIAFSLGRPVFPPRPDGLVKLRGLTAWSSYRQPASNGPVKPRRPAPMTIELSPDPGADRELIQVRRLLRDDGSDPIVRLYPRAILSRPSPSSPSFCCTARPPRCWRAFDAPAPRRSGWLASKHRGRRVLCKAVFANPAPPVRTRF